MASMQDHGNGLGCQPFLVRLFSLVQFHLAPNLQFTSSMGLALSFVREKLLSVSHACCSVSCRLDRKPVWADPALENCCRVWGRENPQFLLHPLPPAPRASQGAAPSRRGQAHALQLHLSHTTERARCALEKQTEGHVACDSTSVNCLEQAHLQEQREGWRLPGAGDEG